MCACLEGGGGVLPNAKSANVCQLKYVGIGSGKVVSWMTDIEWITYGMKVVFRFSSIST